MDHTPIRTSSDDLDIAMLWQAVKKRKFRIFGAVLASGLLTFLVLSQLTPRYSSQTKILIGSDETAYTRPTVGERRADDIRVSKEVVVSQVQVLTSRDLALEVADKLDLKKNTEFNPEAKRLPLWKKLLSELGLWKDVSKLTEAERVYRAFEERLTVYQVDGSHVIVVNFSSRDPQLAAEAANKLADVYIDRQRVAKAGLNEDASNWLGGKIKKLRQEVEAGEARVEKFRINTGLQAGRNNVTLDAQGLSELNSQLILAKARHSEAKARAHLIRKMVNKNGDVNTVSDVLNSALIQRLLEQRVQVQRALSELSATLLPSHPRIRQLSSELSGLKRQIQREALKIARGLENEAQIAGAREASLRASLDELKKQSGKTGENNIKLRALEREAKAKRDLLETYLKRYRDASARRDLASVPSNARIVSRAGVSNTPSFPKKGPIILLAMAAMGFLSVGLVMTGALLTSGAVAQPLRTSSDVRGRGVETFMEDYHFEPVEGGDREQDEQKPRNGIFRKKTITVSQRPTDTTAENRFTDSSLRAVAERLIRLANSEKCSRILIIGRDSENSAAEAAIEIAQTIAKGVNRVILVDMSKGSRTISGCLGLPRSPGLRELIDGVSSFEDIVRRDPKSKAHIITAGKPQISISSKTGRENLPQILNALGEIYDFVLLYGESDNVSGFYHNLEDGLQACVVLNDDGVDGGNEMDFPKLDSSNLPLIHYKPSPQAKKPRIPIVGRVTIF